MFEEREAVVIMLTRLKEEGLAWYRNASIDDVDVFERRISGNFSIFDGGEIYTIARKPVGRLPAKKILIMPPSGHENEEILGLWLRWDYEKDPFEFRLFQGHWFECEGEKTFMAFRFEAPEQGHEHNYYHCQPCRNFGDKELVPHAALVSHRCPTIPLNATNVAELTMCALKSSMGHKKLKDFLRKLLRDPNAAGNAVLRQGYSRCCN